MTRVADASLIPGVTAAAHSIVFQFTLTFRFPFDTVVEREPPACSPFYCRGYIGLLHARIIWFYERSSSQVAYKSVKRAKGPAWLCSFPFCRSFCPPWPRRQRGIKRQTRAADSQLNFCSASLRLFSTFVGLWLRRIKSELNREFRRGCDNCNVIFVLYVRDFDDYNFGRFLIYNESILSFRLKSWDWFIYILLTLYFVLFFFYRFSNFNRQIKEIRTDSD